MTQQVKNLLRIVNGERRTDVAKQSHAQRRWTFTSPDGIGDFFLRLPWLLEMERHGWQLQLIGREPTLEVARLAGLQAELVPLRFSPYSKEPRRHRDPFALEFKAIEKFGSELLFLGPSQPSFLEEEVVRCFQNFRLGGFVLEEDFWPSEGNQDPHQLVKHYAIKVPVSHVMTEPERNQKAASMLLGEEMSFQPFHFLEDTFQIPTTILHELGIATKEYLIVSPGYRAGDYFKGWGEENWIRELRMLEEETNYSFLFTGSASEAVANHAIFSQLQHPALHRDLTGKVTSLKEFGNLMKGAAAYVGKDSGSMHVAAALNKPVLAVMGGGHWKRFFPQGTKAVVLTVATPCRGCDWHCHLEEPVCVRGLEKGSLLQGWKHLKKMSSPEVVVLEQPLSASKRNMVMSVDYVVFRSQIYNDRRRRLQCERAGLFQPWYKRFSFTKSLAKFVSGKSNFLDM